jgi:hypothetical protein
MRIEMRIERGVGRMNKVLLAFAVHRFNRIFPGPSEGV